MQVLQKLNQMKHIIFFKVIVQESNQSIVEPLIALLKSLHIEVQYEGRAFNSYILN